MKNELGMKKLVIVLFTLFNVSIGWAQRSDQKMDAFVDNLMSKMTLKEKLGQVNLPSAGDIVTGEAKNSNFSNSIREGKVGGLFNIKGVEKIKDVQRIAVEESRLGIPLLFAMDVIHGYETVFPIPLGLAATWNMDAVERVARISAIEASADGICWTFSPMADVSRDPRWGRVSEGAGEDPFMNAEVAKAMVYGYQGRGDQRYSRNDQIMACIKHYALYGASEAGRDYNTVDMSRQRMFNEYMLPYQAAVDAGVGSVMASFNEVDGVPATANKWLLTDVLRDDWGFNGFVVTDYTGINEMVEHGIGDLKTVSARALKAGIDMDMVGEGFLTTLKTSLDEGAIELSDIDTACRRVLEAKYKLGLFDDPYRFINSKRAKKLIYSKAHRREARAIAAESFVLLKNDQNTLPLKRDSKVAVVGPLANTKSNMPGTWSVAARLEKPATLVEGIRDVMGKRAVVTYAKGSNLTEDEELERRATMFGRDLFRDDRSNEELRNEAVKLAKDADVIVAALGESSEFSGESSSRTNLDIPEVQKELLKELLATGKPVVLVLFSGRPLTISWEAEHVPAILNVWFGGSEAAYAIADVLLGDVNPSGKLAATFPRNVGQIPIFYNHKNTGRPLKGEWFQKFRSNYIDVPNTPQYPFGYGMSYTTFKYSAISIDQTTLDNEGKIVATVEVTNTGDVFGKEVVQLYIRDVVGSTTRPVRELKGFEKIALESGETKSVSFEITPDMLKFYDYDMNFVVEPGEFELFIGGSSVDTKQAKFVFK